MRVWRRCHERVTLASQHGRAVSLPPPPPTLDELFSLLLQRGHERYDGEAVDHLAHALQCATLAQCAGAGDALITAALLHDIGHLVHGRRGTPSAEGLDDWHEVLGAEVLAPLFAATVSEPVRLHVRAKRALAADPAYRRGLSTGSRRSLALQGGPMRAAEAQLFLQCPHADAAIRLRRWDDAAKTPCLATPPLAVFEAIARRCARPAMAAAFSGY